MEKVFENYREAFMYHLDHEDTIIGMPNPNNKVHRVFICDMCGMEAWGSHTSKHCPDCNVKLRLQQRADYCEKRKKKRAEAYKPTEPGGRIKWDETNLTKEIIREINESEAARERRECVNEWNQIHCCPFFEGSAGSVKCFYCMRGINYAGASTLSNRRCPNNPIASDGSRYIQRAAYGKNPNGSHGVRPGKRYDVADNMPQHLKVQLVERMQKLGRQLYLWSNGHVDITPEPDSNS